MKEQGIPETQQTTDTLESLKAQLEAVRAEKEVLDKRLKDTQKSYTQGQQSIKSLEAQLEELKKVDNTSLAAELNSQAMEDLKSVNPDEWYAKRKAIEEAHAKALAQKLNDASVQAQNEEKQRQNALALAEVQLRNPKITAEFIEMDVPYRIKKELDSGNVSFEEFLKMVEDFAGKEKVVGSGNKVMEQPNLTTIGNREGVSQDTSTYQSARNDYMSKGI